MMQKTFMINGKERHYQCWEKCPMQAGEKHQYIINNSLESMNQFLDECYTAYHTAFPKVTRPKLYVYLCEEEIDDLNAFTDGQDIYIAALAMFGMYNYVNERLSIPRLYEEYTIPEALKKDTPLLVYDYMLRFIVAHELMHIWHSHAMWKRNTLIPRNSRISSLLDEVLSERVIMTETDSKNVSEIKPEIDRLKVSGGKFLLDNTYEFRFFRQVLEIDADCCAICLVLNSVQQMMRKLIAPYFDGDKKEGFKPGAAISFHSYFLGIVEGAVGLMYSYFDKRLPGSPFNRLSELMANGHPIGAIRFVKVDATIRKMMHLLFNDAETEEKLLSFTDVFAFDIYVVDGENLNLGKCFWLPAHTQEVQDFMTCLEKGWNAIRDSLQQYALMEVPEKFSPEELLIPKGVIWFDKNGNQISG